MSAKTEEIVVISGPLIGNHHTRLSDSYKLIYSDQNVMNQREFNKQIRKATGVITMTSLQITKELIDASPKLRIISNFGVGYDNIDVRYAQKRGVIVSNTPDVLTTSCAELGVALIMATSRRLVEGSLLIERDEFKGWKVDLLLGSELRNKTLGVLGCGRIGQALVRIMAGFNMNILYHNRNSLDTDLEAALDIRYVDFHSLVVQSDILMITAPLNKENKHTFTLDVFRQMKNESILINIGRGGIIKESDLILALKENIIGGVGLDVFEDPTNVPGEFKNDPRVTLTPHIGSGTTEARDSMSSLAVRAVLDVLEGKRPLYEIK